MARKSSGKPGRSTTRKITRGPNKGDTVQFKFARGGKPFPTRVVRDVGTPSTLRDNPGVKFGRNKRGSSKKR